MKHNTVKMTAKKPERSRFIMIPEVSELDWRTFHDKDDLYARGICALPFVKWLFGVRFRHFHPQEITPLLKRLPIWVCVAEHCRTIVPIVSLPLGACCWINNWDNCSTNKSIRSPTGQILVAVQRCTRRGASSGDRGMRHCFERRNC